MAAFIYVCLAFVVWDVYLVHRTFANSIACPLACACLGQMVDCSRRGLIEVPKDIPSWVEILELQNNGITVLNPGDFKGLPNLKLLDLSSNDIEFINNTVFNDLQHLITLKMNYNKLTELPVFPKNSSMQTINVNHNGIISIKPEAMASLPNLKTLDLNYNQIMDIPVETFPKGCKIQQLFMNNNRIISLENGCLDNLTSIEWLKMNKNKLMELNKSVFGNLTTLKNLELMKNQIKVIDGLTFQDLSNLQVLKLKRNSISSLCDGAFWGLQKIQNLQLDHNKITNVTKGWLYGLGSLKQLSLANNLIQSLEQDGWGSCKGLQKLDLTHNKITTIAEKTFSRLYGLQDLYLDHNMVSRIDDGAFKDLSALNSLEINHNLISWTIEDVSGAFIGLDNLGKLGLKTNQIKTIVGEAFHGLKKLRTIHLEDNPITSVQENSFQPLEELQELHFNSTNLLCDCQLAWLPVWLTSSGFRSSINAICGHPANLKGRSIFDLAQEDFLCNDMEFPKPIMREHPQSQIALKSDNVTLNCSATVTGDKDPIVMWRKDKSPLINVDQELFATVNNGDVKTYTSVLKLYNVQDSAVGKYHCVMSNKFGSAYSKRAEISVHVFPVFDKKPKDVTVKSGRTAKLECSAKGQPMPEIAWQKDGGDDFPAARERRMHVMPKDDTFFIVNVKRVDEGIYSCTAKNDAGTIVANVSLTVLETPSFIRKMEDKKFTHEGDTTVLECMASGSPKPRLTWMKDNKPLELSERHFFTADDQLLIIVETKKSDAGGYTCEMSNTLGTQRGNSILKVQSAEGMTASNFELDDESTTTGIIIIAVVCCVVGTSLVWVIIIYQTRKRPEMYSATPTDETTLPAELPSSGYASSEKDVSYTPLPIHAYSYQDYQLKEGNYERFRGCGRQPAIFPSDVDEDDIDPSRLLGELRTGRISGDNSLGSGNYPNSETDTISSTQSTQSTTSVPHSLQTFHPILNTDNTHTSDNNCVHCVYNNKTNSVSSIPSVTDISPSCENNQLHTPKHPPDCECRRQLTSIACGIPTVPANNTCDQITPPSYTDCVIDSGVQKPLLNGHTGSSYCNTPSLQQLSSSNHINNLPTHISIPIPTGHRTENTSISV
ncbi:leucine-rich repeats and immunoglobulin-like domains protein 2 [Patella vulgata]|uniref:leucine-rich repeats and immunoglobulin-like domains protein 2 n=1 Tax=Patella vulgata TaxID=6465 RepID=UPI00218065AC|nr:leucine-rich repeats and immunoglobulin-like domains protein 2 [Patella vulgata]